MFYHYLRNIQQSTTFLKLDFVILEFQKLEYLLCKKNTIPHNTHTATHYLPSKKKKKTKTKTKISYHTLHQSTSHAFLTLLSKVLEKEFIQIKLVVVLDMRQRDDITKSVNVGLHLIKLCKQEILSLLNFMYKELEFMKLEFQVPFFIRLRNLSNLPNLSL